MIISKTEYNTIHQWNLRNWTKSGVCETCMDTLKKTYWSNVSGLYIQGDRSDWQELCARCHSCYDYNILGRNKPPGRPEKYPGGTRKGSARYKELHPHPRPGRPLGVKDTKPRGKYIRKSHAPLDTT